MEPRIQRIGNTLKDGAGDWKARVEALRELRSALGGLHLTSVKLIIPQLVQQIGDGRSLVMQEACQTAGEICAAYGVEPEFSSIADSLTRVCLPIVPVTTKVMSEAAKACLLKVVLGTKRGYQGVFDKFIHGITAPKSASTYRLECVKLIEACIREWSPEWLSRGDNLNNIDISLRKAIHDADPEVRIAARNTFTTFARVFPDEAQRSLKEMEPEDRQKFQSIFPRTQVMPTASLLGGMPSVRKTPFPSAAKSMAPLSAARSARKPLQMMSLNATTPTSRVKKNTDERSVTFAPCTYRQPGIVTATATTAKKTQKVKTRSSVREKVLKAVVDCVGSESFEEGREKRENAMRDLASIFIYQNRDLEVSDFDACVHAIESCVNSMYDTVSSAGLDAFGTFILAVTEGNMPGSSAVRANMLRTAFPVALKRARSENPFLAEAANRAINACVESVEHHVLLAIVIAFQKIYNDQVVMPLFVERSQRSRVVQYQDFEEVDDEEYYPQDMEEENDENIPVETTTNDDMLQLMLQRLESLDETSRQQLREKVLNV